MVSTFANPAINSAIRLGTQAFDETDPVQLWPSDSLETVEIVIRAVYKQVLGNAHVMESERAAVAEAESQLRNRTITVRDFIRQIAKSELYRARFFEPCSRNRFIELNFKHLLGRAPNSYSDIADHSYLLESEGFESEIDSYLDSDEYHRTFGNNTVPYYRGHKSPTGQKVSGFANLLKLLRGAASNDNNLAHEQQARLTQAIMANRIDAVAPLKSFSDIRASNITHVSKVLYQQKPTAQPTLKQYIAQKTYQGYELFRQTPPVELVPGASVDDIEMVIRAVYRQVMGNAHIMESERLVVPESQLKRGELSVREFVRQVAKSELYRSRFTDNCYRYRAMELNFKHLLGRAPQTFAEMKTHSTILDTEGYEADIDSYLDSDEYNNAFGENIVPYYRGYRTEAGQTMVEFTNMLQLLKSAASSDKDPATNNAPRLAKKILSQQSQKSATPRDAQEILAKLFRSKPTATKPTIPAAASESINQQKEQDALIAKLQEQLASLRPVAGIGAAILRKGAEPKTVIDSGTSRATSQQQTDDKAALIERLQGELMEARSLAAIGESRLNKWRR